jgi:hypothetical protein
MDPEKEGFACERKNKKRLDFFPVALYSMIMGIWMF